jgi:hypothetical protein
MSTNNLDNVESIRNRIDKTTLNINTMCPEKLLVPDVAHPEQVKHLILDVSFDPCDYDAMEKYLMNKDCKCNMIDACHYCGWGSKYTDTLCKDLINFNHLVTLVIYDLNLSSDLWIKFAENSKCLEEISFLSHGDLDSGYDCFWFDGENDDSEKKDKALEAIFKIPTLEKVKLSRLDLPFFPKGPSNIKNIELDCIKYDDHTKNSVDIYKNYSNAFYTHSNITTVIINQQSYSPFKFSTLRLEKLEKLEKLEVIGDLDGKDGLNSLKAILDLPKLKILNINLNLKP